MTGPARRSDVRTAARTLAAGPAPLLVVSDFDGTLAPITIDPAATEILPLARSALRRLARLAAERPERVRPVVLSGRSAADVAARVRVGGLTYLGNHGIERGVLARGARAERLAVAPTTDDQAPTTTGLAATTDGAASVAATAAAVTLARAAVTLARAVAAGLGSPAWLFVEEKGASVAFHYRQADDTEAARRLVLEAIDKARADGIGRELEAIEGRRVVELRPVGAGDKGSAVAALLARGVGTALVMGDDRSDAEAFEALRERRAAGLVGGLAVAVHGAAETPAEVLARADLLLAGPADAARLLSALARELESEARALGSDAGLADSDAGPAALVDGR